MSKFRVVFEGRRKNPIRPVEVEATDFNTAAATAESQNPGGRAHFVEQLEEGLDHAVGTRFSAGRCEKCGAAVFMQDSDDHMYRSGRILHFWCNE